MNEPLLFNIAKRNIRPVVLEAEDGTRTEYELREMSVAKKEAHMTAQAQRVRYDDKGKPIGYTSLEGSSADLLTRCMFKKVVAKEGGPEWVPVTKEEVGKWPAYAAAQIVKAAQELNKLEDSEKEEAAAKND